MGVQRYFILIDNIIEMEFKGDSSVGRRDIKQLAFN